jgi:hypothetical protein
MDQKILALSLGLPEDASEETIKAKIKALKDAGIENAGLKAEKTAKEGVEANAKIETLFKTAVKEKKITANQVESLTSWAKADFTACESHIKSLPTLSKVSAAITPGVEGTAKEFSAMSDDEKQTMANDEPEAFKAAYFASLATK